MTVPHSTVLVVGAGMAGLKTTIDLTAAGVQVTVLEARDRLGGRLYSEPTPSGHTIDIGASWFHDCLVNPLFEKYFKGANRGKKLEAAFDDYGTDYVNIDGKVDIFKSSLEECSNELMSYLKFITSNLPKDQDLSMRQACYDYLKKKAYSMDAQQLRLTHLLVRYVECWFGSAWENVSARTFAGLEHIGRNLLCLNGFQTVYEGEMEDLLNLTGKSSPEELLVPNHFGVQFHINTEVSKISKNYSNGKIEISTKSSGMFTCDYLVVTTPLAVLKLTDPIETGCITWSPALPAQIRDALDSFAPGNLGKLFLEFDSQFWDETARYFVMPDDDVAFNEAILNNEPLTQEVITSLGVDLGKGQVKSPVLIINITSVIKKKFGLIKKKPILVCLTSEHMTKALEICYRNGDQDGILKLINPALARMSDLATSEIPKPSFIRMTEWALDPYSRGSYTGTPIGQKLDFMEIVKTMINPEGIFGEDGVSRVRFAGEGVVEEGGGCVHGAWISGKREAQVILDLINKPKL